MLSSSPPPPPPLSCLLAGCFINASHRHHNHPDLLSHI
jgi:hypothetical protein